MASFQMFVFAGVLLIFIFIEASCSLAAVGAGTEAPAAAEGLQTKCEYYNETECRLDPAACFAREVRCEPHELDKRNHCFVVWHTDNATRLATIKLKGCFMDSKDCYDRASCIEEAHRPKKDLLFCCCEGDMCNQNFTWSPSPTSPPVLKVGAQPQPDASLLAALLYTVPPLAALAVALVLLYVLYRRRKMNLFNELPTAEPPGGGSPCGEAGGQLAVVLREVRARGRFGAVWRAHLHSQEVAVKVFPLQDKQSWLAEQEIFKLPRMNHPDILEYIGVEKRGDNLQAEYWLITAYHEKGSLCDYLKANTLTWSEAWRVAHTLARGLTHLHDEVAGGRGGARKPAVAHRDFKSKNVLLKCDMSACIADFGLALVFQPGKPCGDTHGQVGTRRYMAPEVLEGAINFTRDAFLRIDMYACGLVLWEVASRCTAWGGAGDYALPLEEEVGAHPSLEEMQDAVVLRKLRPAIPPAWRQHNALTVLCDTMEECWDHDAEARLSASCVMERIAALARLPRRAPLGPMVPHAPLAPLTPLLIENARPLAPDTD